MTTSSAYAKRSLVVLVSAALLGAGQVCFAKNLSLVVSGGISFGSYQAGTTWAILAAAREGKQTDLVNFTGASAGNVNAILGAIDWCRKDFPPNPEDSLLWELWTTTGIEQLMTRMGSVDAAYLMKWHVSDKMQESGTASSEFPSLFQRYYFEMPESVHPSVERNPTNPKYDPTHRQRIETTLSRPQLLKPDCKVALGVTVTSLSPSEYVLPASSISTEVQRQPILFKFTTDGFGNGSFKRLDVARDKAQEAYQRLGIFSEPLSSGEEIPVSTVMKVASASSAFPFAFSPMRMPLTVHNTPRQPEDKTLIASFYKEQWLLDGGVFDNKPLSVSLDLAELVDQSLDHTIYIDQDRRRPTKKEDSNQASYDDPDTVGNPPPAGIEHFGIKGLIGMLGHAVSSGRKYELFTTGRYVVDVPENGSDREPLQATQRYSRVAADHLGAFGAFLGRPLREHDFYAGVYDGLVFYASKYACKDSGTPDQCVADWIGSSKLLDHSGAAQMLVMNLCNSEFDDQCGQPQLPQNPSVSQEFRLALLKAIQTSMQNIRAIAAKNGDAPPLDSETLQAACGTSVQSPSILQAGTLLADLASRDGFLCLLSQIKHNFNADRNIRELVAPSLGIRSADWNSVSQCFLDWDLQKWQNRSDSEKRACTKGKSGRGENRLYLNSYFVDSTFQGLLSSPKTAMDALQTHITWWAWATENELSKLQKDGSGERVVDIFSMAATPTSTLGPDIANAFGLHTKVPDTPPGNSFGIKFLHQVARFTPTNINFDVSNGGYDMTWQPGVLITPGKKVFVNLPLIIDQRDRDPAWGVGLGLRSFRKGPFYSGWDASLNRYGSYRNGSEYTYAVDVGAYLLGNRIRIGIGANGNEYNQWDSTADWRLTIGLSDFGGTAYWLARVAN